MANIATRWRGVIKAGSIMALLFFNVSENALRLYADNIVHRLTLAAGAGLPIGSFSRGGDLRMTSGNALPGLGWNFSYAIAYRQSGIGLDYFSMNADRKGSFETTPAKLIADNDWVLLSTTGSNAWNYSSGVTNYTGIRFFRSFGFGAETQHNVNFSIGIGQCRERNLSTHLVAGKYHEGWFIGGYWDHSLERAESGRKSFGVMPGVEINLHVADHWALHAEAGILYAKMPAVDFYYRYYQGSSTHYESYILNIPSHHLTAGFLNAGITLSIRH